MHIPFQINLSADEEPTGVDLGEKDMGCRSGTGEMKKQQSIAIHSDVVLTLN